MRSACRALLRISGEARLVGFAWAGVRAGRWRGRAAVVAA